MKPVLNGFEDTLGKNTKRSQRIILRRLRFNMYSFLRSGLFYIPTTIKGIGKNVQSESTEP